jgi:hypothetical protein
MTNLPAPKSTISFDRTKIGTLSGREDSGYRMPLDHEVALINAVKRGYVTTTVDRGIDKPTADQVLDANRDSIVKALKDVLADVKAFGMQRVPLPISNSEQSKLWAYVAEFLKNPTKYGCEGYAPVTTIAAVGRDAQLVKPK